MASYEEKEKKQDGIIDLSQARKNRKEGHEKENKEPVEYSVNVPEVMDRIAAAIADYKKELMERSQDQSEKRPIDKGEFICLLSGISTCRKMPGIPEHMGYKGLYLCRSEEDMKAAREHLEEVFGIHDEDSMKKTLWGICVNHDYRQFETFWEGNPEFDVSILKSAGRTAFESAKACAEKFKPIVGKQGFRAWDINEQIGMCRKLFACGMINDKRFTELTVPLAKSAYRHFSSWEEYAVSCLCGAAYFGFRNYDNDENQWDFFQLNKTLVDHLLGEKGAWRLNQFKPQ